MEKVIEVKNLCVDYGNTRVLSNINLDVYDRDYLAIMGPNGGGKSTLLKTILGLIEPSEGYVKLFNETPAKNKGKIGFIPQFANMDKRFPISVHEAVMMGALKYELKPFFRYSTKQKDSALRQLQRVGIEDLKDRKLCELSGGEFQKLLIARALMVHPKILLLDEPTASVDPNARQKIYSLLSNLNKKVTIVMVTHDLNAISRNVKSIACLDNMLIYHGGPELSKKTVEKVYGCPVDLIAHGVPHRVLSTSAHKGE